MEVSIAGALYIVGAGFTSFMAKREGFPFARAMLIALLWPLGCIVVMRRAEKRVP